MKASELRIGNLVKSIGIEYVVCKVDSHGNITGVEGNTSFNLDRTTEPIPLTEEWLLKFGFDLINNEYYQSRNHDLKLHWTVNKNKMIPEFNEKRFVTGYDFKYVHQLQNLYFALTGHEL